MTEYTTSSHAYREYMTARERTAYWVHTHNPKEAELYSPSVPPTVIDGLVPSSPPSEADSSHSTPPKMVLRYNDGRPDVPIPRGMRGLGSKQHQESSLGRSETLSYGNRARSGSSGDSPSFRTNSRRHDPVSRSPEEIRILPSFPGGEVPSSSTSRPGHYRSKSVPRSSDRHHEEVPEMPFIPPAHMQTQPPYYNGAAPLGSQGSSPSPHQVNFAQPPRAWHPRNGGHPKHPPAIIYAPSHNTRQPQYSPPAMFHHPPRMGPNGLIYSHSAPVPGQYPPKYPTPYPSVGSYRNASSVQDVRMDNPRTRMGSLGRSSRMDPRASAETFASEKSGSTYYVLPAHGQKVHVIAPSPEQSVVTATSTTKTPSSPHGYGFGGKKPFFQRLFNFSRFSSSGSTSSGGKRLHRRHSLSAQHRVAAGRSH